MSSLMWGASRRGPLRGSRLAPPACALLVLAMACLPGRAGAQSPSRFSPRLTDPGTESPSGPSLAIYTGITHGGGETGTTVGVQLEVGHAGPLRGVLAVSLEGVPGWGVLEAGVVAQPVTQAAVAPYVGFTGFVRDVFEGESGGIAVHVGADVARSRELALRLEGRTYLSDKAALGLLVGLAIR